MSSDDSFTARGIEFGDVVWQFLPSGVIMGRSKKKPGVHYSLHLGHRSGVLDFHKTDENAIGKGRHETLFAIRWENAARLLMDIQPLFVEAAFDLFQPLRIGSLFHRRISIVQGLFLHPNEVHLFAKRRKRRYVVDEELLRSRAVLPEFLDDVYAFADGPFTLIRFRRNRVPKLVGIAVKITRHDGTVELRWAKLRNAGKVIDPLVNQFMERANNYLIPQDEYDNYPFLRKPE